MNELVLVPTTFERERLDAAFTRAVADRGGKIETCGFGVIAAAARTAQLLEGRRPSRLLLLGIAGALDPLLPIGHAFQFTHVQCDGIGVGAGSDFIAASRLGWRQAEGVRTSDRGDDSLRLFPADGLPDGGTLLTCCAGSANAGQAASRRTDYPDAAAEDMEGYAVALASHFAGIPCSIIRGISNEAGDRDKTHWRVDAALQSASALAGRWLVAD